MIKLNKHESSKVIGGNWENRYFKQWYKCLQGGGSGRACGRAERIAARHQ
tara:strand:+ start:373 stop:522 length:150 start_codon:yes stop_codon:yes gene_type:complete